MALSKEKYSYNIRFFQKLVRCEKYHWAKRIVKFWRRLKRSIMGNEMGFTVFETVFVSWRGKRFENCESWLGIFRLFINIRAIIFSVMIQNFEPLDVIVFFDFLNVPFFMLEHTPLSIGAKILPMKLDTLLWLVFIMDWLRNMLYFNHTVGKLAFIPVPAVSAVGLNPIFAHFCLILGLIAPFSR